MDAAEAMPGYDQVSTMATQAQMTGPVGRTPVVIRSGFHDFLPFILLDK